MPKAKAPSIAVYHATAPTCWWSWGYEATLNRIPLVYGDQVGIHLMLGTVYEDLAEWMKQYEMTDDAWKRWAQESADLMGVPIRTDYRSKSEPNNVLSATYAVLAAQKQGTTKGTRFMRAMLRLFVVEGRDVTRREVVMAAAKEADLEARRFVKDLSDTKARKEQSDQEGEGFPHLPLGFFNLAVTDGAGRTVLLDNAFDPGLVEGAIDYLSAGRLTKRNPKDIVGYLREHGLTPSVEIARVFTLKEKQAEASLENLRNEGKIERRLVLGKPHWHVAN